MDKRKFHSLDVLRGIAAFAVVFWHADWLIAPLRPLHGDLAVDLFFVMSGFVIAHAYEDKLRSGLTPGHFIVLRLIRLYPLYLLGALIGLCVSLGGVSATFNIVSAFLSLAMLPTPTLTRGMSLYPYNLVAWSLLLEIIVNIVYAFTWRRWTVRGLAEIIASSSFLLIVATILHGDSNFGWTWRNLPGGIARVFFGFPAGVLIYRLSQQGRLPLRANFFVVMLAAVVLLSWRPSNTGGLILDLVGMLVATPAIVAFAIMAEPPPWSTPIAATLGAASYAIYALHLPLLEVMLAFAPRIAAERLGPLPGVIFAIFILGFAVWIDNWFDGPARRFLMRWAKARELWPQAR
jgi:peptidoglycan/LPS O-acetylase OafA/YrhL